MRTRVAGALALASIFTLVVPSSGTADVFGTDVTYTTDADFDNGTLVSVNHDAPNGDQLQLDTPTEPFPFVNVAASGRGTVVRVNTDTGESVGEYRTAPEGRGLDPSRTTVDLFGNVWTANRGEIDEIDGTPHGSAVKIGLIVGGTRVDATGSPDPAGGYVAPPFGYNTCVDRDADGLIRTSSGLLDVLDWPDVADGLGGADGIVEDAVDECVLVYQRLPDAEQARHVSVDADNNVWVGGYPFELRQFHKLDGTTGAILDSFDARDIGCGGYGGLVDGNGILWSIGWGWGEGALLRYDPATGEGSCVNTFGGYGLGVDTNGSVWASIWENGIVKVSPDGVVEPGFPKTTYLPPVTTAGAGTAPRVLIPNVLPAPRADDAPEEAPDFQVAPDDDWVGSFGPWTPGTTVSLTIEDGTGVLYSDSQTVDTDGNFNVNLWDVFDLQRGHIVTVSDGTTTKTHTVMNLYVDGIDIDADTVFGRADAGTDVDVWVHDTGANLTVMADGSGNWVADFAGITDLTHASDGGSQQFDPDGDATGVWWSGVRFIVSPDDDWVQSGSRWTPGSTISLTIEDGSGVLYTDSQTADSIGNFNFGLWDVFDVQRGHVVTVSDGTNTKTHTVTNLYVDGIDVTADTVFGRADPGTDVHVWTHDGDANLTVSADGSGNWTADLSSQVDLTYGSGGGSQQTDTDGDATELHWAGPTFTVSPDGDRVQSGSRWTPGSTVTLTIEDGSGVLYTDSQTVDSTGSFNFNPGEVFDVQRGHTVTVSDGTITKSHVVRNYVVDGVDVTADTVFGRADPGTDVHVWVHQGDSSLTVAADGSGNWVADFSGLTDLTYFSDGNSQQLDDDGDATWVFWSAPRFSVSPVHDWVGSMSRWTPGSTISLTIEDGTGVLYTDSQTADTTGTFDFNLGGGIFDVQRGHLVTVSDGTNTKTHQVLDLYVDVVDVDADVVAGRGVADQVVDVFVHDSGAVVTVTTDGSGAWSADFTGAADITFGSQGDSQQYDDDGDATVVWWGSPTFAVNPDHDWVESTSQWTAGSTVSLTIEDGSGVLYADSRGVDEGGYFRFDLGGVADIERGHLVTLSDGATTKTHQVTDLYVDVVDVVADTVSGRAAPSTEVEVWLHDTNVNVTVTADGAGNWTADLSAFVDLTYSSAGGAKQTDGEGDSTEVHWALPRIGVDPDGDGISGWSWTPGAELTISVDGAPLTTVVTSESGDFGIGSDVDLVAGQTVMVVGPRYTKTLLLTDPNVTELDEFADTVSGTATPLAQLDVWAATDLWAGSTVRSVTADGSGVWTADFSVPVDDWPALDIESTSAVTTYEFDDDGDATIRNFGPPTQANRGVAVTPIDNHVWVANSGVGTVTRLDNDGNVLTAIEVGDEPTGVAVDAAGKVWVTNLGSDNTMRIDPNAGADGLGAVDLTVDLGEGAAPYNYSDMTGAVVVGSTSPQGFWTVVQDSGQSGFEWGRITWNTEPEASEPAGAAIVVEARTSDTEAGLGAAEFAPISNGELFSSLGRYIEVRVTLKASPEGLSPVLSDIRVQPAVIEVDIDIEPWSSKNIIRIKYPWRAVPVAVLGDADFDVTTIDVSTLRFGPDMAAPIHDPEPCDHGWHCLCDWLQWLWERTHLIDVDHDGHVDLVTHYRVGDTGLEGGDTEACLVGETIEGVPIEGCDSVDIRTGWW